MTHSIDHQPEAVEETDSEPYASSPEYLTLRRSFKQVVDCVTLQPTSIRSALFAKGYIPDEVRAYTTTNGISDECKAQKLLDAVLARVKLNPDVYHGFLKILGNERPWTDDIIKHLEGCFHLIKSDIEQTQLEVSLESDAVTSTKEVLVTVNKQEDTNELLVLSDDTMSYNDLIGAICQLFGLEKDGISRLQLYGKQFDEYMALRDTTKIQDKSKINVVYKKQNGPFEKSQDLVYRGNDINSSSSQSILPAELQADEALSSSTVKQKFWSKGVLRVHFINPEAISEWKHHREPITTTNILAWAAVWNDPYDSGIPTIEMADNVENSDIRVMFLDKNGGCSSVVGTEAKGKTVTMVLDLNQCPSDEQRSQVIHVFGHALGLEHEHQRPEFWDVLGKHFELEKMKDNLRSQSGEQDDSEFERLWMVKKGSDYSEFPYDPNSIMHFRFDVKWLKGSFSMESYIDRDDNLSKKEKKYLKAIHMRSYIGILPKNPSKTDIQKLMKAYESISKIHGKDVPTSDSFKHPTSNQYISFDKKRCAQDEVSTVDESLTHIQGPKTSKIWRDRSVLRVYFMNPGALHDWKCGISGTGTIMSWASSWNSPLFEQIPRFEETDAVGRADIRVKFSDVCGSWSAVGTDVYNVRMDNPTMMLDLKNFSRDFQKYLVVHQFGHALGLEHEHQRIDFWESIEKHIDEKKMQDDPSVGNYSTTEAFKRDWLKLERKTHREAIAKCNYDPQSIMHWWFSVDWLKNPKYHELENIKSDSILTDDEKKFLSGIHARNRKCAKSPSKTDIEYLQSVYLAEGKHETVLASEFEKFSPTEILKHVDWSKTEGIWVSTKILEVATDDASVKQTWKQVALSTAQFDKTLFLEIARKSLKDNIIVKEDSLLVEN